MARLSDLSFEEQARKLFDLLILLSPAQLTEKHLAELLGYARDIPEKFIPPHFASTVALKFNVDESLVQHSLLGSASPLGPETDFELLVPKHGWLHDYIEYTRYTEPPTVFHFFSALVVLGSTVGRRVYFPRGSGNIFANLSAVLVAPPGKCKKTTACNLAVNLFRRIGGNVLADKITPEAIVESFQQQPTAQALIYAPEWAVFLGKQQYMEGLVPMLTALFDCPDTWSSATIMRGAMQLQNVFLSHLAATTIDWMQTSITKDAFAGGFMSRLLFVVQKDTPRKFPLPPPLDAALQKSLTDRLLQLQHLNGIVKLSPEAEKWYVTWYTTRQPSSVEKHFAGYYERKPDRLLQLAIILQIAEHPGSLILEEEVLKHADKILVWLERYLPDAFEELAQSQIGDDQLRLLKQLRRANGELDYSSWLRMNTSKMNSDMFKKYLETLKQAKLITVDPTKNRYFLLSAGKASLGSS